jgi:serine/threonine protein kinase
VDVKLAKSTAIWFSGEGGFGFVVHCRKKSTGKHYAMKLQTKKGKVHTRNACLFPRSLCQRTTQYVLREPLLISLELMCARFGPPVSVFLSRPAWKSVVVSLIASDAAPRPVPRIQLLTAFSFTLFANICTLGLLECFQDDPWRADFEKQAFASCQHPFIVNLDYAFQTDSLAIMVLGLATAGDLQKVRCGCHAVVSVCSVGDLECAAVALLCWFDH